MDETQYCAEELNGWTVGKKTVLKDTMGRPLMSRLGLRDEVDRWDRELC